MNQYYVRKSSFGLCFRELYRILCILNRHKELERLVQWAARKRLTGPLKMYRNRLADEERRLLRYSVDFPRLFAYARLLFQFNHIINSAPRYPAKGSAKAYRYGLY